MAKKPNVLGNILLLLESMSEAEAEDALKKIDVDPKDYGMGSGKELIDHWHRCVEDLLGND